MDRKHWKWLIVSSLAAVPALALIAQLSKLIDYARIASGYTAQQTCSCLYVSRRALASCMADYPAEQIKLIHFETAGGRVRISAFGVFRAAAVFEEGYGCRTEP